MFITLSEYLQWLDWTCRQLKPGKRGTIPKNAPPFLDRLDLSPKLWLHAVEHFGKRRAANRVTPAARFDPSDQTGLEIELVYLPPYHSKYNPIERFWGVLKQHWNGTLLSSVSLVLNWAETATW